MTTSTAEGFRMPVPIKIRRGYLCELPKKYQAAVENASDCLSITGDEEVRIETYHTSDIRSIVEKVWQWPCTIADLKERSDEIARVRRIMGLKSRWPYVSYWADDMEELASVEVKEDGEVIVSHGDGWHRIIAAVELGRRTVEILFIEP